MMKYLIAFLFGFAYLIYKPSSRSHLKISKNHKFVKPKKFKPKLNQTREVLELLILSLSAGMTVPRAISKVSQYSKTLLATELNTATQNHVFGGSFEQELVRIGQIDTYWRLITSQLQLSFEQGARILENLIELDEFFIDLERSQIMRKVRSAGVRSVLPLGICFLPAFLVVVVIPLVASIIQF